MKGGGLSSTPTGSPNYQLITKKTKPGTDQSKSNMSKSLRSPKSGEPFFKDGTYKNRGPEVWVGGPDVRTRLCVVVGNSLPTSKTVLG